MLFGLLILLASVAGTAGIVGFTPVISQKWKDRQGKKWDRKFLEGAQRAEDEARQPTPEEIAEAARDLDNEDLELERKFKELEAREAQRVVDEL